MSARHVVVMGVAGCGKSAVAAALARRLGWPLVEGDAFHPPANIAKMKAGIPLQDADRTGWLAALGVELQARPDGAVLTCSALKRAYREALREACPGLRFLHLVVDEAEARARTAARPGHFYPPALVASQFATLEDPAGEPGVLALDATAPIDALVAQAERWLAPSRFTNA